MNKIPSLTDKTIVYLKNPRRINGDTTTNIKATKLTKAQRLPCALARRKI